MKVTAVELSVVEIMDIMQRANKACAYWAENGGVYVTDDNDNIVEFRINHGDGIAVLDAEAVNRGVCLAVSEGLKVPYADLGYCDLASVDAIVQYGVFGKLVYG